MNIHTYGDRSRNVLIHQLKDIVAIAGNLGKLDSDRGRLVGDQVLHLALGDVFAIFEANRLFVPVQLIISDSGI